MPPNTKTPRPNLPLRQIQPPRPPYSLHRLRSNKPSTCDETQNPLTGAFNWVITVVFEDGVEWLFRSPRHQGMVMMRERVVSGLVASEAATVKYLRWNNSGVPVPEVVDYR